MIYFIVLALLIVAVLWECFFKGRLKDMKMLYFITYYGIVILLVFISGLRYETGLDQNSYIERFNDSIKRDTRGEYGYYLLNLFFKKLFDNYFLMQFCISLFCLFVVGYFFYRRSDRAFMSLFIYYCLYFFPLNMTIMRHSIAVSILILGYKFYEQRKIIKYLIITILAAQFHNTALIMILAYFIPDWRRNKVILFSYFISLFVIINGQYILQSILKILSTLYFLPPRTIYLLSLYTKAENAAAGKDVLKSGFGLLVLVMLVTMVVIFHLRIKKNKYVPAFITVFFFIACGFNIMILSRFAYYFSVSFAGLVAYNLLLEKRFYKYLSYLRLIVVLLFIIYFSLLMIRFIFSNENIKFYLPYKSIISIS